MLMQGKAVTNVLGKDSTESPWKHFFLTHINDVALIQHYN